VVLPAVELDSELAVRPVGVDLVAVDLDVRARAGDAVLVAQDDERGLEVAARVRGLGPE
jgi:hypothetical protein